MLIFGNDARQRLSFNGQLIGNFIDKCHCKCQWMSL